MLKRGKPKKFLVELQVKASIDISITPDPQAILASLESLKVTHKILKVKVVGHPAIAEILRSSNLFKRLIDKIIDKAVPSKVNDALKKELDQINKNGIKINQLKSHVAKIGTNGVTYPESNKEISLKALLSFVKTPNQIELEIPTELNHEVVTESDQTPVTQGFKYLEDISENTELTTNNLSANPIFVASKHIRAELNQEVINTITKVAFDEGLINFQINNQLINKVSQGKDDLFNLNTKFFEKSLPCLADYPNQNFTISINALTAPLSNITNDGKQQLINFDLSLNIKYLLDKDPNIVLLNINANAEGGVILLPVQNPELTVFINVSSIKLSKVELLQKCGKLTGDDIANALGPPLRLIPKILNLKVLQNGLSIKPDIAKPLNLTNIESTTTNGLVNIDILANF